MTEDSGWRDVLDLDAAFSDDHNTGDLSYEVVEVGDATNLTTNIHEGPIGNRTLEVLPARDFFGTVGIVLRATDLFGASTVAPTFNVTVLQTADRPSLQMPPDLAIDEGVPFTLAPVVEDPDLPDDAFSFSVSEGIEGLSIDNETGEVSWTPGDDQVGDHSFTVTVVDRFGLWAERLVNLTVRNTNDPPRITSALELDTIQDVVTTYIIKADDPDLPFGDQLAYSAHAEDLTIIVDSVTGAMGFTPTNENVPAFTITIEAQDSTGVVASAALVVRVENVNDPPSVTAEFALSVDQGEPVTVRLGVEDPDLGLELPVPERITYSSTGPDWLAPDGEGWINFTADQSMVGTHEVTYRVTDLAGDADAVSVTWTIVDVNDPPSITPPAQTPVRATEDVPFSLGLSAVDPDGDTVTWSEGSDLFDIDGLAGLIEFTPTHFDVGEHVVSVSASDGHGGSDTLVLTIVVVEVDDPPVIASIIPENGSRFVEGETISFEGEATDEEGDDLVYTWLDGDKVFHEGRTVRKSSLSPGHHVITLRVSDGNSTTVRSIELEVDEAGPSIFLLIGLVMVIVVVVSVTASIMTVRKYSREQYSREPVLSDDDAEEDIGRDLEDGD